MTLVDADDRAFMQELLRRHEEATDAMVARLDAGREGLKSLTRKTSRDHREFIEELRAQREALFRFLDRLDDGGAAAGA
jgi:hypothetical protein